MESLDVNQQDLEKEKRKKILEGLLSRIEGVRPHIPNEIFGLEKIGLHKSQIAIDLLKIGFCDAIDDILNGKPGAEGHWPAHIGKSYLRLRKVIPRTDIAIHEIGKQLIKVYAPIALLSGNELVPFWYRDVGMFQEAEDSELKLINSFRDDNPEKFRELSQKLEQRGIKDVDKFNPLDCAVALQEVRDFLSKNSFEDRALIVEKLKKDINAELDLLK